MHTCAHFCYKMRHSWIFVWYVVSSVCNDMYYTLSSDISTYHLFICENQIISVMSVRNMGVIFALIWRWICISQKPVKMLNIISTTSGDPKILEPESHVHDHTCIYHKPDGLVLQNTPRIMSPIDALWSINRFHSIPTKIGKLIIWIHPELLTKLIQHTNAYVRRTDNWKTICRVEVAPFGILVWQKMRIGIQATFL